MNLLDMVQGTKQMCLYVLVLLLAAMQMVIQDMLQTERLFGLLAPMDSQTEKFAVYPAISFRYANTFAEQSQALGSEATPSDANNRW